MIGEYLTEGQPTQDAKTRYLTADHLGTPRIKTNAVGAVVSRSDCMPYGEEIARTAYGSDTGHERDGEKGSHAYQEKTGRNRKIP